ncbi:uncharacterized protein LOC106472011 [Limulus polyphemus]|uniref:Uncharacterized protein LOC106472011 n=1 Tax=Limulus polyphemus TaxID=6850 RepID=A0ABM1BT09_LIMPO|nr:uncharacterized protein LOC106472011 [Limulus polyphemus]
MTIVVKTELPFNGMVHVRDFRRDPCVAYGNGYRNATLRLSLLANSGDMNYCGIKLSEERTEEKSVVVVIRAHRTLELSDDKFYHITCGKSGFLNARNELSRVLLRFMDDTRRVNELIVGRQYVLRAGLSHPDNLYGTKVKSCFIFAPNTTDVELIDAKGCPKTSFLSQFKFNQTTRAAEAMLYSTFRFPDTNKIHFQCDIVLCRGHCIEADCVSTEKLPQALPQRRVDDEENVQLMASTTVFVLEPGEGVVAQHVRDCTEWQFPWLIGLCICLAILLLVMLIVNIFLCSSLTCTCMSAEETVDKESSEMEDYDPYRVGWIPSSHYGSRSSLNKPYMTSGCTNHSMGSGSDQYIIVHTRPNSRHSHSSSKDPVHRGPGSSLSTGKYSSRM